MKIENPFSKQYFSLFFPLLLVMVLDLAFTLIGQSQDYWRNFQFFNEANPAAAFLMSHHPALFLFISLVYLIIVLFSTVNLRKPFNLISYIFFFLVHGWGSSSWFSELLFSYQTNSPVGWYLTIGYFLFISLVSGFSLSAWLKDRKI